MLKQPAVFLQDTGVSELSSFDTKLWTSSSENGSWYALGLRENSGEPDMGWNCTESTQKEW